MLGKVLWSASVTPLLLSVSLSRNAVALSLSKKKNTLWVALSLSRTGGDFCSVVLFLSHIEFFFSLSSSNTDSRYSPFLHTQLFLSLPLCVVSPIVFDDRNPREVHVKL